MSHWLDIAAKTMSVVLYPLFLPTYGIALFCYAYSLHVAPMNGSWIAVAVLGTFILTCVLPITAIWIMMRHGQVKDLYIDDPRERTMPYIYACMGFGFWSYLLAAILHAPLFLTYIAIGATIVIGIVAFINRWWKISAHLAGFGGLVGGLIVYCIGVGAFPTVGTMILWFGLSWALMIARIHLNAHTPAQACAGWLVGMTCTALPYCITCLCVR